MVALSTSNSTFPGILICPSSTFASATTSTFGGGSGGGGGGAGSATGGGGSGGGGGGGAGGGEPTETSAWQPAIVAEPRLSASAPIIQGAIHTFFIPSPSILRSG